MSKRKNLRGNKKPKIEEDDEDFDYEENTHKKLKILSDIEDDDEDDDYIKIDSKSNKNNGLQIEEEDEDDDSNFEIDILKNNKNNKNNSQQHNTKQQQSRKNSKNLSKSKIKDKLQDDKYDDNEEDDDISLQKQKNNSNNKLMVSEQQQQLGKQNNILMEQEGKQSQMEYEREIEELDLYPKLQNIVATVNLGCTLDLKQIALQARNAEYNPKRFAAVIMRLREPKTTALIFSSGKMVCTGAKNEQDSNRGSRKYAKIIQKLGFNVKFTEFKIQNIVGSTDVKFPINLDNLEHDHKAFVQYEPEIFPGLIYREISTRIVLLIFVSGKIVLTGAKTREKIVEAFKKIYAVLKKYMKIDHKTKLQQLQQQQQHLQQQQQQKQIMGQKNQSKKTNNNNQQQQAPASKLEQQQPIKNTRSTRSNK